MSLYKPPPKLGLDIIDEPLREAARKLLNHIRSKVLSETFDDWKVCTCMCAVGIAFSYKLWEREPHSCPIATQRSSVNKLY